MALHLARLDDGNEKFFGGRGDVEDELRLRELIRHALGDVPGRLGPGDRGRPEASWSRSATRCPTSRRRRCGSAPTSTSAPWPEQKHAATMGLGYAARRARRDGYRRRAVRRAGRPGPRGLDRGTSPSATATQVVWPQAPVLKGVTMVLLQIAMTMNGIAVDAAPGRAAPNCPTCWPRRRSTRTARPADRGIDDLVFGAGQLTGAEAWDRPGTRSERLPIRTAIEPSTGAARCRRTADPARSSRPRHRAAGCARPARRAAASGRPPGRRRAGSGTVPGSWCPPVRSCRRGRPPRPRPRTISKCISSLRPA